MKGIILFIMISCSLFADWTADDRTILRDIRNNGYDINSYLYEFRNGYTSTAPAGYAMGWRDFYMNSYLMQREISEAKEYKFRVVDGQNTTTLVEQNSFSERNETLFDQNDYAQENKQYYEDYIFSFFPSQYSHTWDNSIPDQSFLSASASGDMMNKFTVEMNNAGYGIDNIKNSAQTQEIRGQISLAENSLNGMFNSSDYSSSVISWDLSALGQVFVDRHIMSTNPLQNLRGYFRLKPSPQDYHYTLWYNYFRDGSTYGTLLRNCVNIFVYFLVLLYVVNDLMSIVDA